MHIQRNFKLSCNQLDFFYRVVMERDKVQEWTMENAFKETSYIFMVCLFHTISVIPNTKGYLCDCMSLNLSRTNYNSTYEYTFIFHKNY